MADADEQVVTTPDPVVDENQNTEQPEITDQDLVDVAGPLVKGEVTDNVVVEEEPETEEEPEAEPAVEEKVAEEAAPEAEPVEEELPIPKVETADPGDFTPKDYSFEVKTLAGKTVKITTPEEAEAFASELDTNPELLAASQYTKFNINTSRMTIGIEGDKRDYDSKKEQFDSEKAAIDAQNQQLSQWNNELNYLQNKGDIPPLDPKNNTVEAGSKWGTELRNEPGVKERMDILQWVEKENTARRSAGIAEVSSMVDAFRLMQSERQSEAVKEEKTTETKQRQSKGSMVGGNAPHIPSNTPKGSIVGSGGTLSDLLTEMSYN